MTDPFEVIDAHLRRLTETGRFLNAGLARIDAAGEIARSYGRMVPGGAAFDEPRRRIRMASISKAATARAVISVARRTGTPLGMPVGAILGPGLPGVTLDHLLSHTSGLTDHGGYLVDPPGSVADFIAGEPLAVSDTAPGTFFRYANLNYILLGLALERMAQARFDAVLRAEVLAPAGIAGGFNWAGVAPADRQVLATWQRRGDRLSCEADGPEADWSAALIWRGGAGVSLEGYRPGHDTTFFSPHAGLRMSVLEAARLARFLASDDADGREQRRPRWLFDGTNGEDCDGLFTAFGAGLTLYEDHPRIPGRLFGHAGHALGFMGGAWFDRGTGAAWAYFLNGSPDLTEGQHEEAFYAADEAFIMERL